MLLLLVFGAVFYVNITYILGDARQIKSDITEKQTPKELPKIKRYYVAVTNLDSDKDEITKNELTELVKSNKAVILGKDKNALSKFFEAEIKNTADEMNLQSGIIGVLRVDDLNPKYKVLNFEGKSIWEDSDYSFYVGVSKKGSEEEFDKSKIIKMTTVGDIILGRTVYVKMLQNGWISPFRNVAEKLKQADVTFGNLENPLSDSFTPPTQGMSFLAPTKAIEGLVLSGIDIVGLANNHSTNFGAKVFRDTLQILKNNKIEYVGGGENITEAKSHKILDINGKKFAFLDVNSIIGDVEATENSAGDWKISFPPWGTRNEAEIQEILGKINAAKKESDFTIIMIHWGKEYTHDPSPQMKTLGHEFIDAGADLVVGTHPHWMQGVEAYKNGFIAYSLGNFVFDQEWSLETKQGLIMDTIFYKDKLVNISLTPVLIEDYHRPRILGKEEEKGIMDAVWESTRRISN